MAICPTDLVSFLARPPRVPGTALPPAPLLPSAPALLPALSPKLNKPEGADREAPTKHEMRRSLNIFKNNSLVITLIWTQIYSKYNEYTFNQFIGFYTKIDFGFKSSQQLLIIWLLILEIVFNSFQLIFNYFVVKKVCFV